MARATRAIPKKCVVLFASDQQDVYVHRHREQIPAYHRYRSINLTEARLDLAATSAFGQKAGVCRPSKLRLL
jgi:hypothetical protein